MTAPHVTLEKVETALRQLPPERLADVLLFVEFLEYQDRNEEASRQNDAEEDAALWAAVEANHAYKAQHPGEMIIHESGDDFLTATADL